MVYCETCGQDNAEGGKYCRYCGATLSPSASSSYPSYQSEPPREESIGFGSRRTGENLILKCSLCGSQDFAKDKGRLDSKWGWTSFKVIMLTCKHCGHIELFNKGRSIWDFD